MGYDATESKGIEIKKDERREKRKRQEQSFVDVLQNRCS